MLLEKNYVVGALGLQDILLFDGFLIEINLYVSVMDSVLFCKATKFALRQGYCSQVISYLFSFRL
jgi:hypothetical protein